MLKYIYSVVTEALFISINLIISVIFIAASLWPLWLTLALFKYLGWFL